MNKLVMSILVLFVMGWNSPDAMARSKRKTTSNKVKYSRIKYEAVWFSQLNQKQQLLYLKTIERLTMQMARRGVVQNDNPFLQFLIPYVDAANRINNGFVFDGANDDADYDAFLEELNVLGTPIDPSCSGNNQVCSPTMGMVCEGSNPGVLACSPDSTPTCTSRGNIDCLHRSLTSCGLDAQGRGTARSTDYCEALDRVYRRGTENVAELCESGSFSTACNAANERLAAAGITDSPEESSEPTGADCEQMVRELEESRDTNRPGEEGTANNSFWRNMRGFAQQACGHSSLNSVSQFMGTCSERNMTAPGGGLPRAVTNSYNRDEDSAGFNQCLANRIQQIEERRDARLAEVREELGDAAGESIGQARLRRVRDVFTRDIANARRGMTSRGTCTIQETAPVTDARGNTVAGEYDIRDLMSLASKFRSNENLSESEENRFRAGTGLTSREFRNVFCESDDHNEFKTNLRNALVGDIRVNGVDDVANLLLGQARAAEYKMGRCLAAVRPVDGEEGTGCRLYAVNDSNSLRCATPEHPVLAVNRSSNRCMLVTGFTRDATATEDVRNVNGEDSTRRSGFNVTLNIRTPGRNSTMDIRSESFFNRDYQVQEYRCDGDRSITNSSGPGRCWMNPEVNRRTHPYLGGEEEAVEL